MVHIDFVGEIVKEGGESHNIFANLGPGIHSTGGPIENLL